MSVTVSWLAQRGTEYVSVMEDRTTHRVTVLEVDLCTQELKVKHSLYLKETLIREYQDAGYVSHAALAGDVFDQVAAAEEFVLPPSD